MKTKNIVIPLFVLIVFCQLYLPSFRVNIILQCFVLGLIFVLDSSLLTKGILKMIVPLLILFCIGIVTAVFHDYKLIYFIKDISHFLKPIVGLLLGYFLFKKVTLKDFVKIIILTGFLSAIFHVFWILFFAKLSSLNINDLRNDFGKDNFLELLALLFVLFYRKFQHQPIFKKLFFHWIIIIFLTLSNILYFSRTMMIGFLLALLSIYGFTKINKKNSKIFLLIFTIIGLFYVSLFSFKIDRNKPGLESLLYKIKIAPSEVFNTKIDKENHKELWDHWRGYEAKRALVLMRDNPSSYFIGNGFGSLINLKFKAPLDKKGMKYISETHNGYIYIFYKTGIIGLILLLWFLIKLYLYSYQKMSFISVFIVVISVFYFFSTLTITGIYNPKDVVIFILGGLIALLHHKNHQMNQIQ
jgi:hypothetical protein